MDTSKLMESIFFFAFAFGAIQSTRRPDSYNHRDKQKIRCTRLIGLVQEPWVQSIAGGVLLSDPRAICKGWRFLPWRFVSKQLDSTSTSGSCQTNVKHHYQRMNATVFPNCASAFFCPCCT
jgi:hypothetical protein